MEADIRAVHIERYFPDVLSNAKEMQSLAAAVNPELVSVWKELWKWSLNTFVSDIDEAGANRWEAMLNIRPNATDTLSQRRITILAKINTVLPYTHKRLIQILDTLCGAGTYEILIDYTNCEFGLQMFSGAKGIDSIYGILQPILPMNLNIFLEIVREAQSALYVGSLHQLGGRKRIGIPAPEDTLSALYVGAIKQLGGRKRIGIAHPPDTQAGAYVGTLRIRTGLVEIGGIR